MVVYTSKHETMVLKNDAFSSGGEGEVRVVISGPTRFKNICVKVYYQKKRTPEQEKKIKYMVSNPPAKVDGNGFLIGWPLDYVTDTGGKFMGFVMPLAFPDSKQLITLTAIKLSKKLDTAWHDRYDRANGKSALVARMKLICNIAIPLHILHSTGKYVLKDFKPENVLITHDGRVTIVDMDSVQISEGSRLLHAGTAATLNYMPPEYYNQGVGKEKNALLNKSWDNFAIGVVFYQILFGLHPFVVTPLVQQDVDCNEICHSISNNLFPFGSNNHLIKSYPNLHNGFKKMPNDIQKLFVRAFSDDSSMRPNADDWGKVLRKYIDVIESNMRNDEINLSDNHFLFKENYSVFFSYKRVDKERVFSIKNEVENNTGLKCWIDLDGVESDAQFANVIIKAINNTQVFLFMYSHAHSEIEDYDTDWTVREINFAQKKKKRIVFINLDGTSLTDWFELMFGTKQQIDASSDRAMQNLYRDLRKWLKVEVDNDFQVPDFSFKLSDNKNVFTLIVNSISYNFIKVKSGSFIMGATKEMRNPTDEEFPTHQVELSHDFYIGETVVTQDLWEMIMGNNPSWFKGSHKPVDTISFKDVKCFINKLKSYTKLSFRLPYEAEWEYAARGGKDSRNTRFIGGDNVFPLAWYNGNSKKQTHEVKLKQPNELGLYDMGGNIWEWCQDWYSKYDASPQIDPKGPSTGTNRVVRGGSWNIGTRGCRASYRDKCASGRRGYDLGVRLVIDFDEDEFSIVNGLYDKAQDFYWKGNYTEAFPLFRKLAELGDAGAQTTLGLMYRNGKGVSIDYSEAICWYKKAAQQGDPRAQYALGVIYKYSRGVVHDIEEAKSWYKKAAEQGHLGAQKELEQEKNSMTETKLIDK